MDRSSQRRSLGLGFVAMMIMAFVVPLAAHGQGTAPFKIGVLASLTGSGLATPAVLLTLLFLGSTRFTESISLSKYPSYAQYQKRTSALLPLPPRG